MILYEIEQRLQMVRDEREEIRQKLGILLKAAPYMPKMLNQINEKIYIFREFITWLDRREEEILEGE